jgi:hypothetical protein
MSTASPVECAPEAALRQVLERRHHAAIDLARRDVLAAAGVDLDHRVRENLALDLRLRGEQDLADAGAVGEGVLAGGAVDRGRLEQLPAVENGLRVDRLRAAPGGGDREVEVGGDAVPLARDPADHGAADHVRTLT